MLCEFCQPFQYSDLFRHRTGSFKHRESLVALIKSAQEGCELCQGFVQCLESSKRKWSNQTFLADNIRTSEQADPNAERQFWCTSTTGYLGGGGDFQFSHGNEKTPVWQASCVKIETFVNWGKGKLYLICY